MKLSGNRLGIRSEYKDIQWDAEILKQPISKFHDKEKGRIVYRYPRFSITHHLDDNYTEASAQAPLVVYTTEFLNVVFYDKYTTQGTRRAIRTELRKRGVYTPLREAIRQQKKDLEGK